VTSSCVFPHQLAQWLDGCGNGREALHWKRRQAGGKPHRPTLAYALKDFGSGRRYGEFNPAPVVGVGTAALDLSSSDQFVNVAHQCRGGEMFLHGKFTKTDVGRAIDGGQKARLGAGDPEFVGLVTQQAGNMQENRAQSVRNDQRIERSRGASFLRKGPLLCIMSERLLVLNH
jgi:hypothetical protein